MMKRNVTNFMVVVTGILMAMVIMDIVTVDTVDPINPTVDNKAVSTTEVSEEQTK